MTTTISDSGIAFNDGTTIQSAINLGLRNRIINGGMVIDQRNAGASVTIPSATVTYTLDRWAAYGTQASKFSVQQNAGAVTPPAGYSKYLGVTSLSAYSVLTTDSFFIRQPIEGFNVADLAWGTASAKTVTLSFWVRSSLTGTFGGSLTNATWSYPFTYTVNAANTWEQKTVTVAGSTSGTWATDNTASIYVTLGLGVGSTSSGTASSWANASYNSATGATSVVGTNAATFYITGVQLELGSTATPFEHRPYGMELSLCQRYYYRLQSNNTSYLLGTGCATTATSGNFTGTFPVTMRTAPTALEQSGTASQYTVQTGGVDRASSSVPIYWAVTTKEAWGVTTTVASGQTAGLAGTLYAQSASAYFGWSAEL